MAHLENTNILKDFMGKYKLLVTTGDSISNYPSGPWETWPKQIADILECDAVYGGHAGASDGLIARYTMYHVLEALKTHKSEEILVGVMWGIPDVVDIYNRTFDIPHQPADIPRPNVRNPTSMLGEEKFYLMHPFWNDEASTQWYEKYHDPIGARILALEHILRIQWFLEKYNITYFMAESATDSLIDTEYLSDPDIKFLHDQIDFSKFVNQDHKLTFHRWAVYESGIPLPYPGDPHPSTEAHTLYVEKYIVPHLKKYNLL